MMGNIINSNLYSLNKKIDPSLNFSALIKKKIPIKKSTINNK